MKHLRNTAAILMTATLIASCSHTTQLTSGRDYVKRYDNAQAYNTVATDTASSSASFMSSSVDAQVRQIASVEPDLHFPARIGLARIQNGQLTIAPEGEMIAWAELSEELGAPYGEFVPVSPFIAAMVRPPSAERTYQARNTQVVADIRRASARQHLDYVLVYEVNQRESNERNGLSFADLTVLGLFVLPTRSVKIDSTASAMLIDVRNGYPYGTASAYATNKQARTAFGSGANRRKAMGKNYALAVVNLTNEVETMMKELWAETNTPKK